MTDMITAWGLGAVMVVTALCLLHLYRKKIPVYPHASHRHVFQILIPARNEEAVIGSLIESLQNQTYPQDSFRIAVLVNQSSDHTDRISMAHGVEVLKPDMPVHTKAEVLKFAFRHFQETDTPDAYVIIDADNVLAPDFLEKMNDALSDGVLVAQGRRRAKNASDSIISGCYDLYFILQNSFVNCSRDSAALNGTGWMISQKIIQEYGYPAVTMSEDLEYLAISAMQKTGIGYVHEAVTYDEYISTLPGMFLQLKRWLFGLQQCVRCYTPKLFHAWRAEGNTRCRDALITYLFPVFLIVLFLMVLVLMILSGNFIPLLILYVLITIAVFLAALKCGDELPLVWKSIPFFMFFMALWVPVFIIMAFRRNYVWEEIHHSRDISIDDIMHH